jgi:hypothetical protein
MNSTLNFCSTQSAALLEHLSDDQIDDHLIGDLASEPSAHLAECAHCCERVALAAAPIASFDSVTMAWSERRSATLPIPDLSAQRPLWQRHMTSAMACFTFVLGVALINADHQIASKTAQLQPAHQNSTFQAAVPAPVPTETASVTLAPQFAPPDAQISTDNQMLKAVDDEIQPSLDSPSALGLEPVRSSAPQRLAVVSVRSVQD